MKPVLYFCGTFIPNGILEANFELLKNLYSPAANTFYSALLEGFIENGYDVTVTTYLPSTLYKQYKNNVDDQKKVIFRKRPCNRLLKCLYEFFNTIKTIFTIRKSAGNDEFYVLFNVLRLSQAIGGLFACYFLNIRTIGVLTDVPGHRIQINSNNKSFFLKTLSFIGKQIVKRFDYYVLLSEAMREVLPVNNKNYVVIEGIYCSSSLGNNLAEIEDCYKQETDFIVMYAGSLEYRYGIMELVNAVRSIHVQDIRLDIYGSGEAETDILCISKNDSRIRYYGMVPHSEILKKERQASLLVNPRPVNDDYVKFSFPSKTMEYMASGTPVLMTEIPSLPREYCEHVFLLPNNEIETIKEGILRVYYEPQKAQNIAMSASEFIRHNKTHIRQVQKIIQNLGLPI